MIEDIISPHRYQELEDQEETALKNSLHRVYCHSTYAPINQYNLYHSKKREIQFISSRENLDCSTTMQTPP